jgi:hypothetical protein
VGSIYSCCGERFKYQEFIGYDYAEVKISNDLGNVLEGKKFVIKEVYVEDL